MDSTVTDPLVGYRLGGRYLLTALVAKGGMATVYTATDERLRRTVAVKVMHRSLAEDANFVRRFVREARAAATLSHPGAVAVFDQGEDDGLVYLVMEYVAGRTLREELAGATTAAVPIPVERALSILEQVLSALAAAHDNGLVHLDVKPENVLLRPDGQVKVADFGLARAISSSGNNTNASLATATGSRGLLMGTIAYLSPEQVTEGTADTRSDVYSTGIMAYEVITGRQPHTGDTPIQIAYRHVNTDVPPPSDLVSGLPNYVDGLVLRATARDRMERPADARAFLQQLQRVRAALQRGGDDPELTDDLTLSRRQVTPKREHTLVAPVQPPAASVGTAEAAAGADSADATATTANAADPAHSPPADSPQTRTRGKRILWIALVVLLLAIVGTAGGWYYTVGRYTDVPEIDNLTTQEAREKLTAADLELDVAHRVHNEHVARGRIIRSNPDQGGQLQKGSPVNVWVSRGPERFAMPDLSDLSEGKARQQINQQHLRVANVNRVFNEQISKGKIVSYSPDPGTKLRRGTGVKLTVSKGREPIEVPSVVGTSSGEAEQAIKDAKLVPSSSKEFSDSVPEGNVISQQPADGTLFRGDEVSFTVSKGPEMVEVPLVVRKPVPEAEQALKDAGLVPETKRSRFYGGLNVVVNQTPVSGEAKKGSKVTLEVI